MYLYTLKQLTLILTLALKNTIVVNRFKKNVSLHVETTINVFKKPSMIKVVNRFKKNVSLHVETTLAQFFPVVNRFKKNSSLTAKVGGCESL
jgi:hypothetical protein